MAFDKVFHGPPSTVDCPADSLGLGVDITNNILYVLGE